MGVLTQEFVQECLDRHPFGIDVSKLISEIAQGANATDVLLSPLDRSEITEWLGNEIEALVDEPVLPKVGEAARNNGEILLGYLEKTKDEGSSGLVIDVERDAPEESALGSKYYQVFYVTARYEGVELASCAPHSEGEYKDGKWIAQPVKWSAFLEGLIPLPKLVSEEPEVEEQEAGEAREEEKREREVSREIDRAIAGSALEPAQEGLTDTRRCESPGTPDLFR